MMAASYQVEDENEDNDMVSIVRLLLEAGADVNVADESGETALAKAVNSGSTKIASLLRKHGAIVQTA